MNNVRRGQVGGERSSLSRILLRLDVCLTPMLYYILYPILLSELPSFATASLAAYLPPPAPHLSTPLMKTVDVVMA